MTYYLQILKENAIKYFEEISASVTCGLIGWRGASVYTDWVYPVLLSAMCATVGVLVTHFVKRLLKKWKL